ncbi:nucleotide disphospho-sugar-binding domain-containing protein [Candidatus Sarcina troglodytae]|uniref:nucleotide disphospho-sugar-binding domain-containing protein n=1 Tax=Candidatus Sarcina troglodytae TaxID=2726954 RepID=UPI002111BB93|nr:nucleotide disphospho-sugar-binding domain-containing protein [Sarcina sp. JB2]
MEALKNTDVTVIISIGKTLKKEQLGKIPNNFYVYNFVPQIEVLKRTDLFITHGGMNSTSEAMYFGVPLIVVPQVANQPIVEKRIEDLELGRVINKNNISSNIIRNYANEILNNDRYKDNMMKMRTKVRQAGGENKAVELINDLLKEKLGSD